MKHPVKNKSRWGHETDPPRPQGKPKNIEKPDIQACCIEKIRNNSSLNNGIVENQSRCSTSMRVRTRRFTEEELARSKVGSNVETTR